MNNQIICETAGFLRRVLALIYDTLVIVGIILFLSLLLVLIHGGPGEPRSLINFIQILIIVLSGPLFYSYFWLYNNGQTLGMQSWRIKLVSSNGQALILKQVLCRCLFSLISALALGLGYLWILVNKDNLSWADMISNTKIVRVKIQKD